jgi:hypothetical protein
MLIRAIVQVQQLVIDDFQDSDSYNEFLPDASDNGWVDWENGVLSDSPDYHIAFCYAVLDHIGWADPDCLRHRPMLAAAVRANIERLAQWWDTQGRRMHAGLDYLTDVNF